MSKQMNASLYKVQLHPLSFNLFPYRKFFLPMYLTCEQSDFRKRDLRSPCAMVRAGGSLLRDTTERDAKALKGCPEQGDTFLVERASKINR